MNFTAQGMSRPRCVACQTEPIPPRPIILLRRNLPATTEFLRLLHAMIDFLIPQYAQEGKTRLTVAIGCTGGRHRSVFIAEELAEHLSEREHVEVTIEHRDLAFAA